ncbi:MAG TPA: glutathione peroxidase [Alloiococcus sp.]|nr:glutathione peroxidase [Alloiococcus sp.]
MTIYDFKVKDLQGNEQTLEAYKNKVLLIVNTATKCGLVSQLGDFEDLYQTYGDEDFAVLAFPCNQFLKQEPLKGQNIENFCQFNYDTTFTIFDKIKVNGDHAHPLYKYLKDQTGGRSIKWNYTKFLINKNGEVVHRYAPVTKPKKLTEDIEALLQEVKSTSV